MDSIRENRTKEDFVAELGLLFNEDIDGSLCVVLVEGTDDVRFMENLLEDNVVCEEVPYGGKHGSMIYENGRIQLFKKKR